MTEWVADLVWGARPVSRYRCDACGISFLGPRREDATVDLVRPANDIEAHGNARYVDPTVGGISCPSCGQHPMRVRSTRKTETGKVRFHKCQHCGKTEKSLG